MTGTLESYNFAGGIHLANQDYTVCIRQEAGYCSIEYTADTFKVSLGVNAYPWTPAACLVPWTDPASCLTNTMSGVDNYVCQTDYITIPQGKNGFLVFAQSHNTITGGATAGANENHHVFCGAFLNPLGAQTANAVVKTSQKPFQIHVHFDSSEVNLDPSATTKDEMDTTNPTYLGFQIKYVQTAC